MADVFCIKECANWILSHKFLKVGLEFVDDPQHAVTVCRLLKKEIGFSPIVLQDSNRACGNCCIDERTAKPRNIEAIIHFGRTCLTPTQALPVLYVLSSYITINLDSVTNILLSEEGPKKGDDLILVYDILCYPSIALLSPRLKQHFPNLISSTLSIPDRSELIFHAPNLVNDFETKININDESDEKLLRFNSRQINLPENKSISDYNFIFIGPNSSTLIALQMHYADKIFYNISPTDNVLSVSNFVKVVMGRSRKIEQVKEAKTIGLLITLIQGHQEILQRLKNLIKSSNRRCYSFFMGKINEAKLANIVGVDVFVYIGCPESSLFDRVENAYLYKNIVTPWELEVALNPSFEWNLNFETNFKELLKEEEYEFEEFKGTDTTLQEWKDKNAFAVVQRNAGTLSQLHQNAAGEAFLGLSWQGLNPSDEGSVPLGTVVEGRKGIAMEYTFEGRN